MMDTAGAQSIYATSPLDRLVRDALTLTRQTLHVADKLLLSSLPESPLLGDPGIEKRAVWSQPPPGAAGTKTWICSTVCAFAVPAATPRAEAETPANVRFTKSRLFNI